MQTADALAEGRNVAVAHAIVYAALNALHQERAKWTQPPLLPATAEASPATATPAVTGSTPAHG